MIRHWLTVIVLMVMVFACSPSKEAVLPVEGNAVYYWRTDLRLDSTERAFLDKHQVKRIYCRYFDVVNDRSQGPMPNATLTFSDRFPKDIEVVPTVFIMEECMHHPSDSLARQIVSRIMQMNETNDVTNVHEIQIDCDYTLRSREAYYRFLEQVQEEFTTQNSKFKIQNSLLSTTIRLHQLSMPAPPVDYGVLMLYNTGDPQKFEERNPILDLRDVMPYIKYLKDYPLPMGAAYPVFTWQRTIHGIHIEHTASFQDIMTVKERVENERDDLRQLILTYHLSTDNINRYKTDDYEKIYRH